MSERAPVAAIVALGVTQNIGYGTLYYSFSILAPAMAADFAWPTEWNFGALLVALLIGGLTAPWLGALFDRIGAGRAMTIGSSVAAAALVACAFAPFVMAFAMANIGISLSLTVAAMLGALAIVTFGLIVVNAHILPHQSQDELPRNAGGRNAGTVTHPDTGHENRCC